MPKNDPNQSKFFGPKKGLNRAEAPLKRALPNGPNAGAPEFATEFKNFYIDPNDGLMKPRPGFALINKNISLPSIGELGIERFNNYNENGEAEPVLLCLGRSNSYTVRKASVGINASSGNHTLTIIFHPTSGLYEVVHKNADTGEEIDRLSLSNVSLSSLNSSLTDLTIDFANDLYTSNTYDGSVLLSNVFPIVDLEINSNESNEIHFDSIEEVETCVDLSGADIDNASSTVAVFSEINNTLFITLPGLPLLKYTGSCIAKAGLPDPNVVSKEAVIRAVGVDLSDSERDNNPVWDLPVGDGTNFALRLAEATNGTISKFFNNKRDLDPSTTNSIYALAYQSGTLLSTAVGSERGDSQKFVTESRNTSSANYVDNTVSPTQTLTTTPDEDISHEITVKNLQQGNGWEIKGADVGEKGWVLGAASDNNIGTTNWTVDVNQHNFETSDIGKKIHLNVTLVQRDYYGVTSDQRYQTSGSDYIAQQFLIKTELISLTPTSLELSKDITWFGQPGGLESDSFDRNYDLIERLFEQEYFGLSDAVQPYGAVGFMVHGGASIDQFINIYESIDIAEESFRDEFRVVDYPEASFNLVAQIANNPFTESQVFYNWYDRNLYGDIYNDLNRVGDTNNSGESLLEHSSIPKGKVITSHKGRLYITQDPEAINTVYGTSLVFGPEKYNVTGDDSFEIKDDIGDFIVGLSPLGSSLAVLKSNSTHIVQGDFATGNIRRDVITSEGFGCLSHHSISQVKDGIAYLSQEGVVYWQYNAKPQMMGSIYMNREAGSEPMSRIRGYLKERNLDFQRSISFNDNEKELYLLYIPKTSERSNGLVGTSKEGLTLVYDYMNDMWFEYENFGFRGGMAYINNTLYRANSIGTGTDISGQSLNREWQTGTLFDFQDDFQAINWRYDSDWDAFLEPSIYKKPMHIKVFGYGLFEDVLISSPTLDLDLKGEYRLKCEMYNDYRDDKLHTRNSMQINSRKLAARTKTKSQLLVSAKVSISNINSDIFKAPCIMGIEVEYQVAHRGFQRPWSAS